MPNNGMSHTNQPVPLPRDYEGGSSDFDLVRILDGHAVYAEAEDRGDGTEQYTRRNAHDPNS